MQTAPRIDYPLGPALEFLQRVWRLNHALESLSSRMVRRRGITAQQRFLLRCLETYPGMTGRQLAALLHVDPGTVSTALKRLEGKGFVDKRRDPRDRRRTALGLTPEGWRVVRQTRGTVEGAVERLLGSFEAGQLASATTVLGELTTLMEQAEPE